MKKMSICKLKLLTQIKLYASQEIKKKAKISLIAVNPSHVIYMRDDSETKDKMLNNDQWPEGMDQRIELTKMFLNSGGYSPSAITVVGDLESICKKLTGK